MPTPAYHASIVQIYVLLKLEILYILYPGWIDQLVGFKIYFK